MPPKPTAAVIDIGSNSIKMLVATRAPEDGRLVELFQRTDETRIGTGITASQPRLGEEAMARATAAIVSLLADAAPHAPTAIRLVATSAVRDAVNRDAFIARLRAATGHTLDVLSGDAEARGIARGIACDPALANVGAFYLFDLGGGSLEMIEFSHGEARQLASLQLGCVRVTERCLPDPARALTTGEIEAVRSHVRGAIQDSGFRFTLPTPVTAVATGGTATTYRAIESAASGKPFAATNPVLPVAALNSLGMRLAHLSLADRCTIPGVPPARADVFPAALLTLVEVAGFARASTLRHSFYNLRFGLAAQILETT